MKFYVSLCVICMSLLSYGQESSLQTISIAWDELGAPLLLYKEEIKVNNYQLTEVNLDIDLRQQLLRKDDTPFMLLPEKPKGKSVKYNFRMSKEPESSGFSVTGRGYIPNTRNRTSTGGIKNTAYKDAAFYSGYFCPITGFRY